MHPQLLAQASPAHDWQAVGHGLEHAWIDLAGRFGSWLLLALIASLLLRAWWRRHLYRAVKVLGMAERERLERDLAVAETRTSGEIVTVIVERSDSHPQAHLAAALIAIALFTALLPGAIPITHPILLLGLQFLFACAGYLLSRTLHDVQRLLITDARATQMAEEQAMQEFHRLEMQQTRARTGVLLFVSLLEHRVIVLADEGIHQRVGNASWIQIDRAILDGIRARSLADGLSEGIRLAGALLAEHFPSDGGGENERPNRVVVRRE